MNIVNTSITKSPLIMGRPNFFRQVCRFYSSYFKAVYWHGTSEGAVGKDQLNRREFDAGTGGNDSYLWAFPVSGKESAKKYAMRSAGNTGSQPILIELETNQFLEDVEGGRHDCPALNTTVSRIYMKNIEYVSHLNAAAKEHLAGGYMDKMNERNRS